MNEIRIFVVAAAFAAAGSLAFLAGCGEKGDGHDHDQDAAAEANGTHAHDDGSMHEDHADDHAHDEEVSLGTAMIGDMEVEGAQGHGKVEAGKEGHLVIKLPYNDGGATVVRAWIGTEDRFKSVVGKGEYAPSHDDYDIHAVAPDPLPEDAKWWVEIEKPDGTKVVGSLDLIR